MTTLAPPPDNAAKARAEHQRRSALRAVDDPAKLAKAARIVRAALARQRLSVADLQGDIVKPTGLAHTDPSDDRGAAA